MMPMRSMLDVVRLCEDAVRDESCLVGPLMFLAWSFVKKLRYDDMTLIMLRATVMEIARGGADGFIPD
jgi:hypothetical protein